MYSLTKPKKLLEEVDLRMSINSAGYLLLFPLILIIYYVIPAKLRVYTLALASVCFYSLWGLDYACILLLVATFTYSGADFISKNSGRNAARKIALWANIVFIAGILGSIRFLPAESIIAPIGISFYSLCALGYVADVYKSKAPTERNFIKYILFISFFPVVTSGPIQRSDVFLEQINEEKKFSYEQVRSGVLMIAYGLFAKSFVADRLGYIVDKAYEGYETHTGCILLIGVVAYAFQLYCDFMGYSFIALGSAKALGFELPENFRQPYFSRSVKEFWGRWHISLSTWLRDYIYFPLGGSRKGKARTLINIAAVFIISGIWHGRGLTFIVWGALHGIFRIVEELTLKIRDGFIERFGNKPAGKILSGLTVIWTFILVDFAWLFFRAESLDSALVIIRRIFTENDLVRTLREGTYTFGRSRKELLVWVLGLVIVFIVDLVHEKGVHIGEWIGRRNVILRWALYLIFIAFIIVSGIYYYGYSASTFIYSGF